jgi:N-acetylmuramic acid 6-phosphate (MurNAc-6-P) etherase
VNHKLVLRSLNLIREVTGCSAEEAEAAFAASGKRPKVAMVMLLLQAEPERAEALLRGVDGHISRLEKPAAPVGQGLP